MTFKPLYLLSSSFCMAKVTYQRRRIEPSTKFSLIPLKIETLVESWTLTPKKWRNYSGPVMKSSILLWFWTKFITYFHTAKFCFNWPSNNGNQEGHTAWIFQTPYHLGLKKETETYNLTPKPMQNLFRISVPTYKTTWCSNSLISP